MIVVINWLSLNGPLLAQGALLTLELASVALMISLTIGIILGALLGCLPSTSLLARSIALGSALLRGIPFYVQLLLAYFVLPYFLSIDIPAFGAASGSLGLCSAAYVSQIVQGGIISISQGQWEACRMLGFTKYQTMRFVIVPQALRIIAPALAGECDQLIKSTSVISSLGLLELTRAAMNIVARDVNPLPAYGAIAVLYLCMSLCVWLAKKYLLQYLQRNSR